MKWKRLVYSITAVFAFCLFVMNPVNGMAEEKEEKKDEPTPLERVVKESMGRGVKILRIDAPEASPVQGWKQTRVWVSSVYGETPVLFYSSDDGKFIYAGSIFSASADNLTKRDVGETIPKVLPPPEVDLNEHYMVGKKDAAVKAVLWVGADPYSKELFGTFYSLYESNKDSLVLYIKFYPLTAPDLEKLKALTCYRSEEFAKGLQTLHNAAPGWGNKDEIDAFRKAGDPDLCNDEQVMEDIKLAAQYRLPRHPIAFVNWTMLIERATKENIERLAGRTLN